MRKQGGFTLIEVMVAMVVFVIASAAVMSSINALFSSDARSKAAIFSQADAHDLSSMVSGNPSLVSSLNGVTFTKGKPAPATLSSLSSWWSATQSQSPFTQSVALTTTPATCSANTACLLTVTVTSKPPFSSAPIVRTYELQEGF
jgi:prepilin-type N-terminal cleavage/methylation domain-containing protein